MTARPARRPLDLSLLDELVERLRSEDGCPWDQEQTLPDLRAYLLEEAFEVAEAIDRRDWSGLREEMGDLLFQLAFLGRLSVEAGRPGLEDSIRHVYDKMVERHPHVFAGEEAGDRRAVAKAWEKRKLETRRPGESVLDGIRSSVPALLKSYRMTQKAAGVGFDWSSPDQVREKILEELGEVEAARTESRSRLEEEIGDLLFAVANLARHHDIDPEAALARANLKFTSRFHFIERSLADRDRRLSDASLEEMEALWEEAKALERREDEPREPLPAT